MSDGAEEFVLQRKEVPVRLRDPKTDTVRNCVIREIDGTQRSQYTNHVQTRVQRDSQGRPVGVKDMSGIMSKLLGFTLFDLDKEEYLDAKEIDGFPATIQEKLFQMAKDISGLVDASKDELGND